MDGGSGVLDDEVVKAIAENAVDFFGQARSLAISEHSNTFKWLLASLLTLNSGAGFAIFGIDQIDLLSKLLAGGAFYLGIIGALLIAVFGQRANQKLIQPIVEMQEFWIVTKTTGKIDEDKQKTLAGNVKKASKLGLWSRVAGYFSVTMFSVGLGIAAYSAIYESPGHQIQAENPKPSVEKSPTNIENDKQKSAPVMLDD